ncbi:MAG TPA: D-ribose pyranase [Rectinemataceae bacterium]|nr:D-ribose pyranase [Rectinemataceae bacterium]
MKSGTLLNSGISSVISRMGHGDGLVIGDAGLPIPSGPERIDLALARGLPSFIQTLEVVLSELCVERLVLAEEIKSANPAQYAAIEGVLAAYRRRTGFRAEAVFVPHEEFKRKTASSLAVVRTGECSPYSNVILLSGVVF